jgi:hypothetical protein
MKLTFIYDPSKEVRCLKFGFRSSNDTNLTVFAERALNANLDIGNVDEVAALSMSMLAESNIKSDDVLRKLQKRWDIIQPVVIQRLQRLFSSTWDPGNVTTYLTVSTRCPYYHIDRYFFVSFFKASPMRTCIHELQHFYAHEHFEQLFVDFDKAEKFNEFKESLTVLLNEIFSEIIEEPDRGYPQHAASRQKLLEDFRKGKSILEIAQQW